MKTSNKWCPYCKKKCKVEILRILPIALVDYTAIYEYRCKECGKVFRSKVIKKKQLNNI